eukprot:m.18357 g.18357  ORF g.18357 m.18357 type:complete len:597 (+) comp6292_c0_seq1:146-1936(+)
MSAATTTPAVSPWGKVSGAMASPWGKQNAAPSLVTKSFTEVMQSEQLNQDEALAAELQRQFELEALGETASNQTEGNCAEIPAELQDQAGEASTQDQEATDDFALAMLLQAQFNEEHDAIITEREKRANLQGGKVSVSYDLHRSTYGTDHLSHRDFEDGASDDEVNDEDDFELTYDRTVKELRGPGGEIVTKHNAQFEQRRNQQRMQDSFPLSFPCGDVRGKKIRVSNKVYNKLKTKATQSDKARNRVKEKKDFSTSDQALDAKTRLVLYRLVNSGVLDSVNGSVSMGKEAIVFHGTRHVDPENPESATEECAIKVFKTTLTEFKQRQQFLHGDRRYHDRVGRQSARKLVKLWAEKESANLMRMQRGGLNCPNVVTQNKHILVMSFIGTDGRPARKLKEVQLSGKNAEKCFKEVKESMRTLYHDCRLVHADLSEYNILYHNKKPWIIDVGQAVEPTHPRANAYLFRDCIQICRFFKTLGVSDPMDPKDLYKYVSDQEINDVEVVEFQQTVNNSRGGSRRGNKEEEDTSNICARVDALKSLEILLPQVDESSDEELTGTEDVNAEEDTGNAEDDTGNAEPLVDEELKEELQDSKTTA